MTSRHDIEHIDLNAPEDEIRHRRNQHTRSSSMAMTQKIVCVVHVIDLVTMVTARRTAQPAVRPPAAAFPNPLPNRAVPQRTLGCGDDGSVKDDIMTSSNHRR